MCIKSLKYFVRYKNYSPSIAFLAYEDSRRSEARGWSLMGPDEAHHEDEAVDALCNPAISSRGRF
jgi:hypothetical protein